MTSGTISARVYNTQRAVVLEWRDGIFKSIQPNGGDSIGLPWLAPSLVDQQINGFAGIDLQRDSIVAGDLRLLAQALRRHGCLRFVPTLISDNWGRMLARLKNLKSICQGEPDLTRAIAGWHLEGPFLSRQSGFYGAHDPSHLRDPRSEDLAQLREVVGRDPVMVTLSPELPGAIEFIAEAVKLEVRVALGHTDASGEMLAAALDAGAAGFTHLGNGCPAQLHRYDNILWRVLDLPFPQVSLVPDGAHVSPALFRLIHRLFPGENIVYTTDAMAAAGAPGGTYSLGRLTLEVGADRVVRLPGTPNLAGSALTPIEGVMRAAHMLRCPWQKVWPRFSENVAAAWGMTPALQVGAAADFVLLRTDPVAGQLELQAVCAGKMEPPTNFNFPELCEIPALDEVE